MGSISGSGIAFALPMAGLAALNPSIAGQAQAPVTTNVQVEIVGLRDAHGLVRLCLTRDPKSFPDCKTGGAMHATIKAGKGVLHHTFNSVPLGTYAIAAFHDANGDGKLNTMFGMPKEGFAFSLNPAMRARAPRFHEASFETKGRSLDPLKMKYLL